MKHRNPESAQTRGSPENRRRVVLLVNRLKRGGGAERVVVAIAANLPRDRFEVTVVTTRSGNGPLLESLLAQGVRHVALERRSRFDLQPFRRLLTLLRAERIDVIHAHMFGSNLWAAVLGRLAGVPVIIAHEHTWSYEGQAVRRFLDGHLIGRLVDAFVAVSDRDRQRMIGLEGVPEEKIVVLPNPYLRRPEPGRRESLANLAGPGAGPLIVTVAVLRPQKALEVLLEAFEQVLVSFPQATVAIGGDGERREMLEQRARALGISDRVRFLGWWQDVGGLLEAADLAVISSDYEGSPLFALECMAHRAALVSTDVGNVGELMGGEGVTLVPPRDPSAMAEAIRELLSDRQRRTAQVAAAAARLPRYEVASVTREFADLYETLLQSSSRRRIGRPRGWGGLISRKVSVWLSSRV